MEKTLESPLDCKEIQTVHPKGDQSWVFIGRTDAEAETPILWPPDSKSWLIRKDPHARKDWGQEEKGTTEDEIVGWHHPLNGRGFGWTPGVGDGQGGLACCGSWGRKELDTTEQLNWTELNWLIYSIKSLFPILPIEITSIVSTSPSRFWLLWKYNLSLILKLNTFKHYAIYHFIDFNWESVKEETRNCFKSSQPTGARPWSLVRK